MAYLIDCDAIAHLDGAAHCGAVLDGLKKLVSAETLKTVEQVYDELRRWPLIQAEFKPIKKQFLVEQYTAEIAAVAGQIAEDFDFLFDLSGSRNPDPADPWLIAVAKILGWTVITDERKTSTRKIPYVCRQQSIQGACLARLIWRGVISPLLSRRRRERAKSIKPFVWKAAMTDRSRYVPPDVETVIG